jgi:hypothetical protein
MEGRGCPRGQFFQQARLIGPTRLDQSIGWQKKLFDFHGECIRFSTLP